MAVRRKPLAVAADAEELGTMDFLSVTEIYITIREINQGLSVKIVHHVGSIAREASAAQAA